MTFRKVTYVLAICESCGPDWWKGLTEVAPHFDNQNHARKFLASNYGWRIERHIDGRHFMVCKACATKPDCELYGCNTPDTPDGRLAACLRCGQVNRADQPPGRHPESLPEGLPEGLPEWLAPFEAQFTTKGAV